MDEINEDFAKTSVVLVIGTDDTVHPAADDPGRRRCSFEISLELQRTTLLAANDLGSY